MFFLDQSADEIADLIKASRGLDPADLFLRGGTVTNVYSGEYLPGNVAIKDSRVAYVGPSETAIGPDTVVLDVTGKFLCPGYLEVHSHPWELYNPVEASRALLPLGTTTIFGDMLPFQLLLEDESCEKIITDLLPLPLKIIWNPRIVPTSAAAAIEANKFATERFRRLIEMPTAVGTFELTRWLQLLGGDRRIIERIATTRALGKRVDGHTAGCTYEKLNAVVAAGLDSCHEAITVQEALDRLRLGLWEFLRDSSLRPDLRDLIRIVTENKVHTSRLSLTTDGPSPWYFADKGSVEYLAEMAVAQGVAPITALQMITLNPATYFHLDQHIGGIAPGRIADIVINPRPDRFKPEIVIANGRVLARDGDLLVDLPDLDWAQYGFDRVSLPYGLVIRPEHLMVRDEDAGSTFPVMDLVSTVIARRRDTELTTANGFVELGGTDGLLYASLLDRHGKWSTNGIIKGLASRVEGFATSYTTSHDVVVVGTDAAAMAMAANRLYEVGGGWILVEDGRIISELRLEIGGVMAKERFDVVLDGTRQISALFRERGYAYDDLPYTLLFMSSDLLPDVRLTSAGIFEVKTRRILRPSRRIG